MPPASSPTLNHDCLILVVKNLKGDYQTLGRLLQVSKDMFALTAPILYGQLFLDPDEYLSFSDIRLHRLSYLLMTNSGFVETKDPVAQECDRLDNKEMVSTKTNIRTSRRNQSGNRSNSQEADLPTAFNSNTNHKHTVHISVTNNSNNNNNTTTNKNHNNSTNDNDIYRPFYYKIPSTINYYNLLTRIPEQLLAPLVTPELRKRSLLEFQLYHASKIDTLDLRQESETCLKNVTRFSSLKKLTIASWTIEKIRQQVEEFIKIHIQLFPGMLIEFSGGPACIGSRWYLEMNELIRPKILDLDSATFQEPQSLQDNKDQEKEKKQERDLMLAKNKIFERVHVLGIQDPRSRQLSHIGGNQYPQLEELPPGMVHDIGVFLKHCKRLQELRLHIEDRVTVCWEKAFVYNVTEDDDEKSYPYFYQPLTRSNIKRIRFLDTPVAGLYAVLDQLRNSIERIEFIGCRYQFPVISWNWVLTNLSVLELRTVAIDLGSLQYCTELVELSLQHVRDVDDVRIGGQQLWKPPTKNLKSMILVSGSTWSLLDQTCWMDLKLLQKLVLVDRISSKVEKRVDKMDRSLWGTMDKLEDLTLSPGPYQAFGMKRWLSLTPHLRRLEIMEMELPNQDFSFGEVDDDKDDDDADDDCDTGRISDTGNNIDEAKGAMAISKIPLPSLRDLAKVSKIEILDIRDCVMEQEAVGNFLKALGRPARPEKSLATINDTSASGVDTEIVYDIFPNLCVLGLSGMAINDDRVGIYLQRLMQRPRMSYVHFYRFMPDRFINQWLVPLNSNLPRRRRSTLLASLPEFDAFMARSGKALCYDRRNAKFERTKGVSNQKRKQENGEYCVFTSSSLVNTEYRLQ